MACDRRLNPMAQERDRGLQPERTALAWSRTGFLALLVTVLSVRAGTSAIRVIDLALTLGLAPLIGLFLYRAVKIPREHRRDDRTAELRHVMIFASLGIATLAALHGIVTVGRVLVLLQD